MPPTKKLKKPRASFFEARSQRAAHPPPVQPSASSTTAYAPEEGDEGLDTETKVAILSSLHPSVSTAALMDLLLSTNGSIEATCTLMNSATTPPGRVSGGGQQSSLESFLSNPPTERRLPKPPTKGQTLQLYIPADIAGMTPCTLLPSFLPAELAKNLLLELLEESQTFPPPGKFNLFSRTVTSPHRSVMYTTTPTATPYYYQGVSLPPPRAFTPSMKRASELVESHFRMLEPRGTITAALVNAYAGPSQGVGYHTDALTYIGPRAIICTLSLGVTREFRVQKQPPSDGAFGIHLPHNSLLVMAAGMQENWKHSIPLVRSVDRHEVSGDVRIAITFRWYREDYRPEVTPSCGCGGRMVLRPVWGGERYFWSCDGEYRGVGEGCGFFKWAVFDDEGAPLFGAGKEEGGPVGLVDMDADVGG